MATAMPILGMAAHNSDTLRIERMQISKPLRFRTPVMIDSVNVNGKPFEFKELLESNRNIQLGDAGIAAYGSQLSKSDSFEMGRISFRVDVNKFTKDVGIVAPDNTRIYINGVAYDKPLNLKPGSYKIDIDWLNTPTSHPLANVSLTLPKSSVGNIHVSELSAAGGRMPSLGDFMDGTHSRNLSLSPSGKYLQVSYTTLEPGGKKNYSFSRSYRTADGSLTGTTTSDLLKWMPRSERLWYTKTSGDGTSTLYAVNPQTNAETILASGIPEGNLTISPTEDFAILTTYAEGPAEDPDIYEVIEPEDRQPGWRNRARLWQVNFNTGAVTPLTFGFRQLYLNDISNKGDKILVTTQRSRYDKRPTTVRDILLVDLNTLNTDTIVAGDGFVSDARFSPDGTKVLVAGTPEAFNGVGRNLPADRTPSMTETELFLVNVSDKSVDPVTRDFDPSVQSFQWSTADSKIYFTAEDYDRVPLFVYDPAKRTFRNITDKTEDIVQGFALPYKGDMLAWQGSSASNSDRVYVTDIRRGTTRLIDDPSAERLAEVKLGDVIPFDYVTSRGDTINARYYLPADFDPTKRYPVIVNYYGGCSPTSRNFESRYPQHLYAAQGYAVLVINPSGCTGRGQEWASRHVNTAGQGVAQDIIEGVEQFCKANPWADSKAIGCIGASYGGFITQYLQTQTPIFAAAISHAGISDHTSYWGEGYWGYSYSEVSMANSYPWNRHDLYVDNSPLFMAEKINTPILFLHGDSDHNVPVGESIQMYTALKLLGRPTAFVAVSDQDHHILDYDKRVKWQDTIFAWFEKYLKHNSTWWDTLYPHKSL